MAKTQTDKELEQAMANARRMLDEDAKAKAKRIAGQESTIKANSGTLESLSEQIKANDSTLESQSKQIEDNFEKAMKLLDKTEEQAIKSIDTINLDDVVEWKNYFDDAAEWKNNSKKKNKKDRC